MRCHYCQNEISPLRIRCGRCLRVGPYRKHFPGLGMVLLAIVFAVVLLSH
jgi:hypothetical protein